VDLLNKYRENVLKQIRTSGKRGVATQIVENLLEFPIVTASKVAKRYDVTYPPARNAIDYLTEIDVLVPLKEDKYDRTYFCKAIFEIL
jgi:Fic family protein